MSDLEFHGDKMGEPTGLSLGHFLLSFGQVPRIFIFSLQINFWFNLNVAASFLRHSQRFSFSHPCPDYFHPKYPESKLSILSSEINSGVFQGVNVRFSSTATPCHLSQPRQKRVLLSRGLQISSGVYTCSGTRANTFLPRAPKCHYRT